MYKCMNCGKKVNIEITTVKKIICPYCGYRIIQKVRPKLSNKIPAV